MEITITEASGRVPVTILRIQGEIDSTSYQQVIDAAVRLYEAGSFYMLLDLSGANYISSAGLLAFQSIARLLKGEELPDPEAGWAALRSIDQDRDQGYHPSFKLLNPQPQVERSLDTVGFKQFLQVFTDEWEAIKSF